MKFFGKNLLPAVCLAILAGFLALPVMGRAAEYVPTYMLKGYDPFTGKFEEAHLKKPDEEPVELTFKQRMAIKHAAEEKAMKEAEEKRRLARLRSGYAYIPEGIRIKVEFPYVVSSKYFKKGDLLKIKTAENVILNGVVIIPKGTEGTAYIVHAHKAAGLGRRGWMCIAGNEIDTINGIHVPLRGGVGGHGKADTMTGFTVFSTVSPAAGLLMKGSNTRFWPGLKFEVIVRENVDLDCKIEDLKKVMDPSIPRGVNINIK